MPTKTVSLIVISLGLSGCSVQGRTDGRAGIIGARGDSRTTQRNGDVLVAMMNAVNASDAHRYAESYTDDAVITIFGGAELRGRPAIARYESELLRQFPGTRFALYSAWHTGDMAVVHYAVNSPTPVGPPTGHEGLLFLRFDSAGQIAEEHRYLDAITPMAQSGLLGVVPVRPPPQLPARLATYAADGVPNEGENTAVVRAALAALEAGDGQAFLASMVANPQVDEIMYPKRFVGTRGVRAWMSLWDAAVAGRWSQITTAVAVSDFVLIEAVIGGTLKGTLGPVPPSSIPFQVHRALIVRLENGKLAQIASFMNGKELADAVGRWPLTKQ